MNPSKRMKHLICHLSRVADSSSEFSRPSPSTRAASVDYLYGGGGDATAGAVLSNAQRFLLERSLPKQGTEFTRMDLEYRPDEPVVDDETKGAYEIPDGELCVICVTRRRIPAFIPCRHVVCCRQCALTVEQALNPKCPVCLQSIRGSMRVYYS